MPERFYCTVAWLELKSTGEEFIKHVFHSQNDAEKFFDNYDKTEYGLHIEIAFFVKES